jgi:hypothetical protein
VAVEFVAPCVTATPMAQQLPRGWRKLLDKLAERLPEARWFELERHGFLVLDVDEDEARAHWYAVDPEDPDARPLLTAGWRHRRDEPGRLHRLDPADPLAPLSAPTGTTRPHVAVPSRPDAALVAAARRQSRRRRTALAGTIAAVTALALARLRTRLDGG